MSVQAVAWVLEHSSTRLGARLVLLSIANHAKADGTGAWPSYESLALEARISRRQAIRAVQQLADDGAISVDEKAGPRGTNLYSIIGMAGDNFARDKSIASDQNWQVVTNPPAASDKSDQDGVENVTRTVLEPRSEPSSLAASPSANGAGSVSERIALKNAIVAACGWLPGDMTKSLWGRVETAAKELQAIEADPDDLLREATAWRAKHPDIPVTPQVLSMHFAEWAAGNLRPRKARR